jgi:hypothetical protein
MKRLMMLVCLLSCLATVAVGFAQIHNYWPIEPGNNRWYVEEDNPNITCNMHVDGMIDGYSYFSREIYESGVLIEQLAVLADINPEGDVTFTSITDGADWYPFTPPYLWIDAPLYVGKTWQFETDNALLGHGTHYFEVMSEGWVTVPAGTFYCFEVFYTETFEFFGTLTETHWFADGTGTIKFEHLGHDSPFVLDHATVVGQQSRTWGEIKNIYR